MRAWTAAIVLGTALLVATTVPAGEAGAGESRLLLLADMDGGNGGDKNVDLIVRQIKVQPVRAHTGDVVLIDVLVENRFEGEGTTPCRVYANGKEVGSELFRWGWGGDRMFRMSFAWNTGGAPPGEYKIKATAIVFEDSSSFDNELNVQQPVFLAAPGGAFPGGQAAGGEYTETDPRFGRDTIKSN